jgi:hypothetical protein
VRAVRGTTERRGRQLRIANSTFAPSLTRDAAHPVPRQGILRDAVDDQRMAIFNPFCPRLAETGLGVSDSLSSVSRQSSLGS